MSKAIQKDFFGKKSDFAPRRYTHGGVGSTGKRKLHRPLDRKRPLHLVMKSSEAKGRLSFLGLKNKVEIERIFARRAKQFAVTIHRFENVGNHIHAVVTFKRKDAFQNFLRTVSALIARHVTGARKGKPFGKRFWDHLPFTRVVFGQRGMNALGGYMWKNELEREAGGLARHTIEEYERAAAKARRTGRDIWEFLSSNEAIE
jgi:REP element-mobilizing transposase RayT